ncbi:hypothetical protein [Faecalispora jeddahensis]|uniref:hypothetical protein n=1 Tax=Faecalispora jeddahensis TaxID=1414721 RepID=UPI001FAB84A6|nr:hypothetical protein [Faecalispora jeddahensis]
MDIATTSDITAITLQNSPPDQTSALKSACMPPIALWVVTQPMMRMPATQGSTMLLRKTIRPSMTKISVIYKMWR